MHTNLQKQKANQWLIANKNRGKGILQNAWGNFGMTEIFIIYLWYIYREWTKA